jgi:hypothetical protein
MSSTQLKTIFRVLGEALLALSAMPAEVVAIDSAGKPREMTGKEYIAELDTPDAGTTLPDVTTGAAAQVFGLPKAAEVFGGPVYTMTEKAEGFTREDYHGTGWADDALIEQGYMVVVSPNVPQAAANGSPPAPSAPPTASTTDAAQAAPAPSDAPAPAGSATPLDRNGLPWDQRIHSSSREMNESSGGWKKKRGVSDVEIARVTSELLAAVAQVKPPFTPLAASAPAPAAPAPAAPKAPAAAAAPGPASAPQAPATAGTAEDPRTNFTAFCKWVTANGLTMQKATEFAKVYGIMAMGLLAQPANVEFLGLVYDDMAQSMQA